LTFNVIEKKLFFHNKSLHLCHGFFANNFFTFFCNVIQCYISHLDFITSSSNFFMSFCLCFVKFTLFIFSILLSHNELHVAMSLYYEQSIFF
jgi:hypothetical protein